MQFQPWLFSCLFLVAQSINADMQAVLDKHNVYRCMHGIPPLTWDDAIAANAQAYADKGVYGHSANADRFIINEQCGENLAWGAPTRSGVDSTKAWYEEIQFTEPYGTADSFSDATKEGEAIGHYTQVVWKATTKLGCGKGKATVNSAEGDFWVCQYCAAGNVGGQFTENVPAPVKSPESCGGTSADVPASFPALPSDAAQDATTAAVTATTAAPAWFGTALTATTAAETTAAPAAPASPDNTGVSLVGLIELLAPDAASSCAQAFVDVLTTVIANFVGVPKESVHVEVDCQEDKRRLAQLVHGRRMTSTVVASYTIDNVAGDKVDDALKSLSADEANELSVILNDHLQDAGLPTGFSIVKMSTSGRGDVESMPLAAEGAVRDEALGHVADILVDEFQQFDPLLRDGAPFFVGLGVAAFIALGGVVAGVRRRGSAHQAVPLSPSQEDVE